MSVIGRRGFLGGSALAAGLFALPGCARNASAGGSATLDVAYVNGRVWTGAGPDVRTDAIGTIGGRIAAIGADAVRARIGSTTRTIDLEGGFVTPGLIDCHTHFLVGSSTLTQASLRDANSPAEFAARIGAAARELPKGAWLLGGNWDADRWGGEMPTRQWIDAVAPDTPVAVIRYDLHMLVLNSLALKLAGITRDTPDVPGGVITRDAKGEPTGLLKDAAKDLAERAIPKPSDAVVDAAARRGIALALSKGVTEVHDTEVDWSVQDCFRRLRAAGAPGMRLYSLVPLRDWERIAKLVAEEGRGDDWVRWGGLKVVFDGSLGSRTARFYKPYLDDPSTRGIIVTDRADLRRWMGDADRAGLQVAAHAIGDEANDIMLDVMAEVAATNGARDRRFRIEHAQHLSSAAIPRFAKQGVIASVQPYHAIDDGRWAHRRIEQDRLTRTYAFQSLVASGAHVALGSDWPVAPIDPLTGIAAAVLRETIDGANPNGWFPEQRLTLAQTLAGYTRGGAYAGFADDRRGVIAPGMQADFVQFDRDFFAIPPADIVNGKVVRTIVDGEQRFG